MAAMAVVSESLEFSTRGHTDVVDVTERVRKAVEESGLRDGTVTVFVVGSTAAVTTIEYEPGLVHDIRQVLDRIAPAGQPYRHHDTWGDDNGHAHLRASLIGPSVTVPFSDGRLALGTWQQIVVIDFDTRPRDREVRLQMIGE